MAASSRLREEKTFAAVKKKKKKRFRHLNRRHCRLLNKLHPLLQFVVTEANIANVAILHRKPENGRNDTQDPIGICSIQAIGGIFSNGISNVQIFLRRLLHATLSGESDANTFWR